ncbi:FMN-dependent NADH-azoreductase [Bacillus pumilus]|uniref:FMN-dependent NADH-azoreductase n=1 Tax=Bacillus TaxID=1386 RepID=UPI0007179D66|nr:NAD(P)H-dependent oxidoreductase [Bacillus pumilus]AMM98639.1 FMN-dependent NADH-azoreductase [Bacillus pumilus]KRU18088.1 FMN-dependent NADH-azoreductase [Bacillus pumilus]MCY7678264.1 NAD(P)H-dependent oxidoreductase [Bacillus pumilus]MDH3149071.1 NAD(P)H-dependent oxidoreductase [Bacillus pumilus]
MQTLIINAHPDFTHRESYSHKLQTLFLEQFKERFPHEEPTILHLHETEIPRIEKDQLLRIWDKQASEQTLTAAEEKIAAASSALLAQFKAHHRIVIVSPVHNFNVTSRMKDYIDNILIARETFKYTENGSVGLMTNDYRVLLLQASGSIFTNNDRYTPLEYSHYYLKEIFQNLMGFQQFHIVRAQGTAILEEETILTAAADDLSKAFDAFYSPSGM